MIEKAVASAIEPIVDEILALEKRLESIQLTPGEPGKDGRDGRDAEPVEVDAVVKALVDTYSDELRGTPGASVNAESVAEVLIEKHLDQIKGKDAEPVEVDVEDVVKALIDSPDFMADNHTHITKQIADFESRQLDEVRHILFS